jgi:hypothetical protein
VIRCPHCQLALTDQEGRAGTCPVCGKPLAAPAGAAPATGPAEAAAAVYQTALQIAPEAVIVLHRQRLLRMLAAAALIACLVAPFVDVRPTREGFSPAGLVVAIVTGLLTAGLAYPALLGSSWRLIECWLLGGSVTALVMVSESTVGVIPLALAGAAYAAAVVVREGGQTVRVRPDGLEWAAFWPGARPTLLPWEQVETVTADLRNVTVSQYGSVIGQYAQSTLELRGGGRRLALNSSLYGGLPGADHVILNYCRLPVILWTMGQIQGKGMVRLGSVRLDRDRLSWWRISQGVTGGFTFTEHLALTVFTLGIWGVFVLLRLALGREGVALAELKNLALAQGELVLEVPRGKRVIPVRCVPSGVFLPEIVRMLQGA